MNNIYKVTEANGTVHEIVADESFVKQYYPARWVLVKKCPEPINLVSPSVISRLGMMARFTSEEHAKMFEALKADKDVVPWFADLNSVAIEVFDLQDPSVIASVNMLRDKSIITKERADIILNAEVQPSEK